MCLGSDAINDDPAVIMAREIREALGADVNPEALRTFIKCRWEVVSLCAHKIHGTPKEVKPIAQHTVFCEDDPKWNWWWKLPESTRRAMVGHYYNLMNGPV